MAAPYIIPFNFQPVSTSSGSGTYTVPAGKYARITVTLNASVFMSSGSATTIGNFPSQGSSISDSVVIDVWAKAGDAISFTSSVPSSTSAAGTPSAVGFVSGTCTSSANLNGVAFGRARASTTLTSSNSASSTVTVTGSVDALYYAEEYNVIS